MSSTRRRNNSNRQSTKRARDDQQAATNLLESVRDIIQQNDCDRGDRQMNENNNSNHRDNRTINENLMIKYRPLLTRGGNDEKHVRDAEEFLNLNKIDCTFVGMSRAINKLNQELRTVRMKLSSDQTMSMQSTVNEKKNRVMDFKLFLTEKTYNMFRVTFTMVRNCFMVKQQ